jgi:hypothetical protein
MDWRSSGKRSLITRPRALSDVVERNHDYFECLAGAGALDDVHARRDRTVYDRGIALGRSVRSSGAGTATSEVGLFVEGRVKVFQHRTVLLRLEGFNLFNHGNLLGRAQTTYGDTGTANPAFGQLVSVGTATNALPSLANIDPPRMFQIQVRYIF